METLFVLGFTIGFVFLMTWLVRRDRQTARDWGNPSGQSSIATGQHTDNPHFAPAEPVDSSNINGAPTEELSHQSGYKK